jgi:hypothetical protein
MMIISRVRMGARRVRACRRASDDILDLDVWSCVCTVLLSCVCTRPPVRDSVAYGWNGTISSSSRWKQNLFHSAANQFVYRPSQFLRLTSYIPVFKNTIYLYLITLSDFISLILVNIHY